MDQVVGEVFHIDRALVHFIGLDILLVKRNPSFKFRFALRELKHVALEDGLLEKL